MDLSWSCPSVLLLVILDLLVIISTQEVREQQVAGDTDTCDRTIWDDTRLEKGVRNMFGGCTEGHIDWRHPYGAVRLLLQLPPPVTPSSSTMMEACFRAKSHLALTKISLETDTDSRGSPSASTGLLPLVILNMTVPNMERELCFTSETSKPVGLYLEAQSDLQSTTSGHVEIDYDIQRIFTKSNSLKYEDNMEDCRPCTDAELLQSVCSSDFVVQGSIHTVLHSPTAKESQVRLYIDRIHRQRHPVFKSSKPASLSSTHSYNTFKADGRTFDGEVIVPHKCGIKKGSGEFLFTGRMRLKRALLKCAPRLEDFENLWEEAVKHGLNPCTLD